MDCEILIVGGGIHGVGLLHDLTARHVKGVHLVEQHALASGTSSRSTKLAHGGLRYLEHFEQWALVREAIQERTLLLRLLQGIVRPLPIVIPNFKSDPRPAWMVRMGLFLYDMLGGDTGLPSARSLTLEQMYQAAPYLSKERIDKDMLKGFLYYDAQMLDDVIVRIAAEASKRLGGTYAENTTAEKIEPLSKGGYRVTLNQAGRRSEVTTKVIVNAAGAWCNSNLLRWGIVPNVPCLLNIGSHLVFKPEAVAGGTPEKSAATLLQNDDGRVAFFIPWNNRWLFGTTESILEGDPGKVFAPQADKDYLMQAAARNLDLVDAEKNVDEFFCGVRTMPVKQKHQKAPHQSVQASWIEKPFESPFYMKSIDSNISALSRETVIDEALPNLISIYGGKYTTYRSQCEKLGNRICARLGVGGTPGTQVAENWFLPEILKEMPEIFDTSAPLRQWREA
jgi:glycerol-3-phosphate dehydrogenase